MAGSSGPNAWTPRASSRTSSPRRTAPCSPSRGSGRWGAAARTASTPARSSRRRRSARSRRSTSACRWCSRPTAGAPGSTPPGRTWPSWPLRRRRRWSRPWSCGRWAPPSTTSGTTGRTCSPGRSRSARRPTSPRCSDGLMAVGPEVTATKERVLPGWVAAAVTFLCSGAVLVLEIVGLRLIAPYVGVTLQTSTAVIGFALAAIAMGAWSGGITADRSDPRRLVAPLMVAGGALLIAVLPLVRFTGSLLSGPDAGAVLLLAAVAVVVPAALLSAVPPMVVKLQLASLDETGAVVGRLSGIGTLGGIAATFVTGFVLIAILPSSVILVGTGAVTVLAGIALAVFLRRRTVGAAGTIPVGLLVLALVGGGLAAIAPSPCETETGYHCARVEADPERDSGRILYLDTARHSYVDLEDPTYLEFEYVRAIAAVTDVLRDEGESLSALHIGGGGLTLPRYLAEVRPGTESLVLEVAPGVVAIDRDQLELATSDRLRVRVTDGRVGLAAEPPGARDLVVGDAFGGLSVPC